jgi:hypothetical protein
MRGKHAILVQSAAIHHHSRWGRSPPRRILDMLRPYQGTDAIAARLRGFARLA